jgi:predicted CoA-binding protein
LPDESDQAITRILQARTIAVVGLSNDPKRPSHTVAQYLQSHGYRVVPINPTIDEVLGEKAYKSLLDLPEEFKRRVDVVEIFRRPEHVRAIVDEAIQLYREYGHPTTVWMQLGIVDQDVAKKAKAAGLDVVMDRCMKIEHQHGRNGIVNR